MASQAEKWRKGTFLNEVCISVEWTFGKICYYFSYVDFKRHIQILLQPIEKCYLVAALLTNCTTGLIWYIVDEYSYPSESTSSGNLPIEHVPYLAIDLVVIYYVTLICKHRYMCNNLETTVQALTTRLSTWEDTMACTGSSRKRITAYAPLTVLATKYIRLPTTPQRCLPEQLHLMLVTSC